VAFPLTEGAEESEVVMDIDRLKRGALLDSIIDKGEKKERLWGGRGTLYTAEGEKVWELGELKEELKAAIAKP